MFEEIEDNIAEISDKSTVLELHELLKLDVNYRQEKARMERITNYVFRIETKAYEDLSKYGPAGGKFAVCRTGFSNFVPSPVFNVGTFKEAVKLGMFRGV